MMLAGLDAETINDFTTADNLTDNSNIDLTFFDLDAIIRATEISPQLKNLDKAVLVQFLR